jgi:hypothetical protein
VRRARRTLPFLLFLLLSLAVTHRALLGDEAFYFRDLLAYHAPHVALGARLWSSGEVPLWSPLFDCGQPHLANPQNLALHPLQILYLLLSPDRASAVSLFLLFFLSGAGMYACARGLGASVAGALAAGTAFELSGFILSLGNLANLLATAAPLPLTFLFAARAVRAADPGAGPRASATTRAGASRLALQPPAALASGAASAPPALLSPATLANVVAAGALFALQVLGGDPFIAALSLLLLAALLPCIADGGGALRRLASSAAVVAAVALLAALIDAAVLLPAAAALPDTVRAWGFRPQGTLLWSLRPIHLLEVLLPGLFGNPVALGTPAFWGASLFDNGQPFILALGVGKAALLAAAAALCTTCGRRSSAVSGTSGNPAGSPRLLRGLGWTAVAFTVLALGRHGLLRLEWLGSLPSLPLVRYPVRFFLIPTFALCLLAAFGVERLIAGPRRGLWGWIAMIAASALALAAGATGVLTSGGTLPGPTGQAVLAALARSALACAASGLVLLSAARWRWEARSCALGLVVIAALEPLLVYSRLNPTGPRELVTRAPAVVEILKRDPDRFRIWRDNSPPVGGLPDLGFPSLGQTIWFRETLYPSYGLDYGLAYAFNSTGDETDSKRTFLIGRRLASAGPEVRTRILGAAGVKYQLLFRPPVGAGLETAEHVRLAGPDLWLCRNRLWVPTVRVVTHAYPVAGPDAALERVLSPEHDPRAEVVIEGEHDGNLVVPAHAEPSEPPGAPGRGAPSSPPGASSGSADSRPGAIPRDTTLRLARKADTPGSSSGNATIQSTPKTSEPGLTPGSAVIVEERGSYLKIQARAERDAYLVLSDRFAPGWEARLDGKSAPILRAEYLFRAVPLPAGEHTVEFRYRPASFRTGCLVSLAGLIATALLARAGQLCPPRDPCHNAAPVV